MKTVISSRMLVLGFFLTSFYIVTSAGCGNKETPNKQQTPEKSLTPENNNPTLQVDTTATQKDIILPSSASDSLLNYFRILAKGTDSQLIKEYPAGYAILSLNNGRYTSITNLKDNRIYINLYGAVIGKMNDKEMGVFINEITMETISVKDFYHLFTLDLKPKRIALKTDHFEPYAQLLMKTEAGMIVLVGFKER